MPMRRGLLLLLLLNTSTADANPLFNGFTADYEVSKNNTVLGVSHRRLVMRDQGKKLDFASTTVPTGIIALFISDRFIEHSLIHINKSGIQPQRYEYQRTGGKKEITFQAKFDWKNRLIQRSSSEYPDILQSGTQDLLSFQLALIKGLEEGQKQFQFEIVDHKRIQTQKLNYSKSFQIDSSYGKLDILQLDHKADESHYSFTFWCARQLHYLPVKIIKTENDGDIIQLKLTRYNQTPFRLLEESEQSEWD